MTVPPVLSLLLSISLSCWAPRWQLLTGGPWHAWSEQPTAEPCCALKPWHQVLRHWECFPGVSMACLSWSFTLFFAWAQLSACRFLQIEGTWNGRNTSKVTKRNWKLKLWKMFAGKQQKKQWESTETLHFNTFTLVVFCCCCSLESKII